MKKEHWIEKSEYPIFTHGGFMPLGVKVSTH